MGLVDLTWNYPISDLKFLSTLFWLGPMGLASGAGSGVALLTSAGRKGSHLKQWLAMLLSAPHGFLTEVFWGFPQS